MIYEGWSFMRIIIITLVTVNLAAFALIGVGCQRSLEDGGSAKHTRSHCKTSTQCPHGHFNMATTAPRWKGDRKSPLHCKDPKSNPDATQSSCATATVWMRFHWHNRLNAIALGTDPPLHGDGEGFGSYAAKTFVSPTFNSCFLDSGSKRSAW